MGWLTGVRGRAGAAAVVAAVALAPLTPLRRPVQRLDRTALGALVERRPKRWQEPARRLTALAEPAIVLSACAVAAARALRHGTPAGSLARALASAAGGIAVRRALAESLHRARPPSGWWWDTPSGFSYPSRHVTWAMLGWGTAVALLVPEPAPRRIATAALTTTVAATRLLLAVHWPSDVAAAVAFSMSWRALTRAAGATADRAGPVPRAPGRRGGALAGRAETR